MEGRTKKILLLDQNRQRIALPQHSDPWTHPPDNRRTDEDHLYRLDG